MAGKLLPVWPGRFLIILQNNLDRITFTKVLVQCLAVFLAGYFCLKVDTVIFAVTTGIGRGYLERGLADYFLDSSFDFMAITADYLEKPLTGIVNIRLGLAATHNLHDSSLLSCIHLFFTSTGNFLRPQ